MIPITLISYIKQKIILCVDKSLNLINNLVMEISLVLKFIIFLVTIVTFYAIIRNLDIIKIILIYWKDLIFRK